jgi:hypothetical protein
MRLDVGGANIVMAIIYMPVALKLPAAPAARKAARHNLRATIKRGKNELNWN